MLDVKFWVTCSNLKFNQLNLNLLQIISKIFNFFGLLFLKNGINGKLTNNLKKIKMKKVFSIVMVAVLATAFVSCGPSAEEKAKMEERAKQVADSIAAAISESMNQVPAETAPVDSTAAAATTETAPAH